LYRGEQGVEFRALEVRVAADGAIAGALGFVQLDAHVLDASERDALEVSDVADGALLVPIGLHTRTELEINSRGRLNGLFRDDSGRGSFGLGLGLGFGFGFRFGLGLGFGFRLR